MLTYADVWQRLKLATDPERTGERGAEAIERDMQVTYADVRRRMYADVC